MRGMSLSTSYWGKNDDVDAEWVLGATEPFSGGVGDTADIGVDGLAPFGISPTLSMTNDCGVLDRDALFRLGSCELGALGIC